MTFEIEIDKAAKAAGLNPALVTAVVMQESGGYPWAWRPEAGYRYFWNVRKNTPFRPVSVAESTSEIPPQDFRSMPGAGSDAQEWWAQQASWGLMQVMGALARELGFKGPYLTQICEPGLNLELGCTQLAKLMKWANGDTERALAAYNGGRLGNTHRPLRNQQYASEVLARM